MTKGCLVRSSNTSTSIRSGWATGLPGVSGESAGRWIIRRCSEAEQPGSLQPAQVRDDTLGHPRRHVAALEQAGDGRFGKVLADPLGELGVVDWLQSKSAQGIAVHSIEAG